MFHRINILINESNYVQIQQNVHIQKNCKQDVT
jgi:hypothetical protein